MSFITYLLTYSFVTILACIIILIINKFLGF